MKQGLEHLIDKIEKGTGPPCLLLHGDDFQIAEATKRILDLLAPTRDRSFALERFDGRTTPWDEIEASLMTPPLFTPKKTVLIEGVPYFFSREHKAELRDRVLQLWRDGKETDAGKRFLDLLLLAGWSQERWQRVGSPLNQRELKEIFGEAGEEVRNDADALVEFCRNKGWSLTERDMGEGQRLLEFLEQGLPAWAFLLMTATEVDRRNRLYRRFADNGAAVDFTLPKDRSGRTSREALRDFVRQRLHDVGKNIEPPAQEMILARAGEQLWAVHQELEKLVLYVGDAPSIRLRDVAEIFLDLGEGWIFDLTQAVAERDSLAALGHLERLLSQGDHPLRILAVIASEVRRLLAARQFIENEFRQSWRPEMSYDQFQRTVLADGSPRLTRSAYGDYMALKGASKFSTPELVRALERIYRADIRLKSSSHPPRLVLERLVLELCRPPRHDRLQNDN